MSSPAIAVSGPLYVIYIRRSDKREADADVSDEVQEAVCRGRVPAGARVRVIRDSSGRNSGGNARRPGWQELLALVVGGQLVGVAAYDGSRLARDVEQAAILLRECERRGVAILTGAPPERLREPEGIFTYNVEASTAQFERQKAAKRMRDLTRSIFEGGGHRGMDPFGYRSAR